MATRSIEVERKYDASPDLAVPDLTGVPGVAAVRPPDRGRTVPESGSRCPNPFPRAGVPVVGGERVNGTGDAVVQARNARGPIRWAGPAPEQADPTGGRHAFDSEAALTPIITLGALEFGHLLFDAFFQRTIPVQKLIGLFLQLGGLLLHRAVRRC